MMPTDKQMSRFAAAARLRARLSEGGFSEYLTLSRMAARAKTTLRDRRFGSGDGPVVFRMPATLATAALEYRLCSEQTPIWQAHCQPGLALRTRLGGRGARGSVQARGSRRARMAQLATLASPHASRRSQREKILYTALKTARQGTSTPTGQHPAV